MTVQRWTDEMLDSLAQTVGGLGERVEGLKIQPGEVLEIVFEEKIDE